MKKSELKKLIKEEIQNILNESKEINIEDITWDDIIEYLKSSPSKKINLPSSPSSSREIRNQYDFDDWKQKFLRIYKQGTLLFPNSKDEMKDFFNSSQFSIKPQSSPDWESIKKSTHQGMKDYYSKGSGTYTGD